MRYFLFISLLFILTISACKKDQPIPDKLQGYWALVKSYCADSNTVSFYSNIAYDVKTHYAFAKSVHFTRKKFSGDDRESKHFNGIPEHSYSFTPDPTNSDNGIFKCKSYSDHAFNVTWSSDTLILSDPLNSNSYYYLQEP